MHAAYRAGDGGHEVVDLQAALNSAGAARPPLVTDGQFGGATRSAVIALQQRAGIAPDGIVGPDTRAALMMHGGQGHGSAQEAELGQRISAAVEGQVGAAGTAAGAPNGVSGELTTGLVSGSGSYDAATGQASGAVSTRNGSASGTYNTDTGTGAGSVHTSYGDAGVSVDDTTVHASVSLPGVGDVTVNVDRPDWL